MKSRYYLDGIEVNEPNNYQELDIEIKYDKDGNKDSLAINNWVFGVNDRRNSNDSIELLLKQITEGLTGGVGVFEGKPYSIDLDNEMGTTYNLFNGYVDLSKAKILCYEITAPAVENGKVDWLNDVADSFSFEYLASIGIITDANYITVPYVINKKQSAIDIILTVVSVYIMTQELIKQIVLISQWSAVSGSFFATASGVVSLILQIAYCIILIIAIVKLLIQLFNCIIQPVKYLKAMRVVDHITIGLNYLGLKLSSTILQSSPYDKLTLIPEKFSLKEDNGGNKSNVFGFIKASDCTDTGYYRGTFGEFLRSMKEMFNAKILIDGDTLYFEKQDFQINSSKYQLPKLVEPGYQFNSDELYSNYELAFTTDFQDRNTIQRYAGTSYQVIHTPISIINQSMVLMKNLKVVRIPYALGIRKLELNKIEDAIDKFFNAVGAVLDAIIDVVNVIIDAINEIIKVVNKIIKALKTIGINLGKGIPEIKNLESPNLQSLMDERIDMLMMETDHVNIPKVILVDDNSNKRTNKLLPGMEDVINAKYLYENYHYFYNFVDTNGWNNQMLIRNFENIPFTFDDYEKIRTNGAILDIDGSDAVLTRIKFNPYKQTASGTYKTKQVYTTNIQLNTIYPNG